MRTVACAYHLRLHLCLRPSALHNAGIMWARSQQAIIAHDTAIFEGPRCLKGPLNCHNIAKYYESRGILQTAQNQQPH